MTSQDYSHVNDAMLSGLRHVDEYIPGVSEDVMIVGQFF